MINSSNENIVIKRISDIIIRMNNIIIENKKNTELIINYITNLQNQMNQNFKELKNNNDQVIKYGNGLYIYIIYIYWSSCKLVRKWKRNLLF